MQLSIFVSTRKYILWGGGHIPKVRQPSQAWSGIKMTFSPAGARTDRSLIGLYSIPNMRWMPSVIDSFKHRFGPACASRYLSFKGADMLTISSTCKTQSHINNALLQTKKKDKKSFTTLSYRKEKLRKLIKKKLGKCAISIQYWR